MHLQILLRLCIRVTSVAPLWEWCHYGSVGAKAVAPLSRKRRELALAQELWHHFRARAGNSAAVLVLCYSRRSRMDTTPDLVAGPRVAMWDRSLSTRHWEPRFGVDCMKVRHTPLQRRNVFSDLYFGQLLSSNGCVPALGKFGNCEKSCKNDEKQPENHRKPVRTPRNLMN